MSLVGLTLGKLVASKVRLRTDLFGGLATHAGDSLYEYCYIPEFGKAVRALRDYDGSIDNWWNEFRGRVAFTKPSDEVLLMLLGVAGLLSYALWAWNR